MPAAASTAACAFLFSPPLPSRWAPLSAHLFLALVARVLPLFSSIRGLLPCPFSLSLSACPPTATSDVGSSLVGHLARVSGGRLRPQTRLLLSFALFPPLSFAFSLFLSLPLLSCLASRASPYPHTPFSSLSFARKCTQRTRAGHAMTSATPNHFDFAEDSACVFFLGNLNGGGEQELLRLDSSAPDCASRSLISGMGHPRPCATPRLCSSFLLFHPLLFREETCFSWPKQSRRAEPIFMFLRFRARRVCACVLLPHLCSTLQRPR